MTVSAKSLVNYQVEIETGSGHVLRGDEPEAIGGDNTGPNPYDMLLSALATCKIITLKMYAERKGWPLEGVEVRLSTRKEHAADVEECETDSKAKIDVIETEISLQGDLDEAQVARLVDISTRCPMHRTLTSETVIRTTLV